MTLSIRLQLARGSAAYVFYLLYKYDAFGRV